MASRGALLLVPSLTLRASFDSKGARLSFRVRPPRPLHRDSTRLRVTCVAAALALAACAGDRHVPTNASGPIDDFGAPIVLAPIPRRVVSLNPTTTELVFALGASSRLVGRSHWDTFPVEARTVPDLGDAIRPNVERLIAAHPDLVILYASPENRPAYDRLARAGIRTVALRIDHIAQFDRAARLLGRVLGDSATGATVADSVAATLARVRAATRGVNRPRVVWPVAEAPPIVIGGGSYMSELLDIAGATNVYGDLAAPSPVVSIEDVIARDPDLMIRGGDDLPSRAWTTTWSAVPAVRDGRVARVPTDLVARPSVQLGAAAIALARAIHPTLSIR